MHRACDGLAGRSPHVLSCARPRTHRGAIDVGVCCTARSMKERISRAVIEVGFVVFLFYANLLMGEYEHSGMGRTRGLAWALSDILTVSNLVIAIVAAIVGYVVFEFLRKKLP
jgi:hypothetical protein